MKTPILVSPLNQLLNQPLHQGRDIPQYDTSSNQAAMVTNIHNNKILTINVLFSETSNDYINRTTETPSTSLVVPTINNVLNSKSTLGKGDILEIIQVNNTSATTRHSPVQPLGHANKHFKKIVRNISITAAHAPQLAARSRYQTPVEDDTLILWLIFSILYYQDQCEHQHNNNEDINVYYILIYGCWFFICFVLILYRHQPKNWYYRGTNLRTGMIEAPTQELE